MKSLLVLAVILTLIPTASSTITLDITDFPGSAPASGKLSGTIELLFDELVGQSYAMVSYIDGKPQSSVTMQDFVEEPSFYGFQEQPFDYDIVAEGTSTWEEFRDEWFSYTIYAFGTCGSSETGGSNDCETLCGPVFPCAWTRQFSSEGFANGADGLRLVKDTANNLPLPPDHNGDTVWTTTHNATQRVQVRNVQACGGETYGIQSVMVNGWVPRDIFNHEFTSMGNYFEATIEEFDDDSLGQDRFLFGGPAPIVSDGGGVYKNGQRLNWGTGPGDSAWWNGSAGVVRIYNYDDQANYDIFYIPPNGPKLCAFTYISTPGSGAWSSSRSFSGTVKYNDPYSKQLQNWEMPIPPGCPAGTGSCQQVADIYYASETNDPSGSVDISFDSQTNTTAATTTFPGLTQTYSVLVPFSSFPFLNAPDAEGNYTLSFSLMNQGITLSSTSVNLAACSDADGDGFCAETGDCDDNDPSSYPGGTEACNGVDNDCDGDIDEDFWSAGSKLGNPCGIPGSECAGVFVCTPDGFGVKCNSRYSPGQLSEYCSDGVDNDCDGVTDETTEFDANNNLVLACVCKSGDVRECGSTVGVCSKGSQVCVSGTWGNCVGGVKAETDVCDSLDNNCDGIVDNVNGGDSREGSACGCFGGAVPGTEVCNDIDDDCNGVIDDNVKCCSVGETRECGSTVGVCSKGTQDCQDGSWGPCVGGVQPVEEVCYNSLDDNCNGEADELCTLQVTCANGIQDLNEHGVDCGGSCPGTCSIIPPFYIYLIAGGLVVLVIGVILTIRPKF